MVVVVVVVVVVTAVVVAVAAVTVMVVMVVVVVVLVVVVVSVRVLVSVVAASRFRVLVPAKPVRLRVCFELPQVAGVSPRRVCKVSKGSRALPSGDELAVVVGAR